MNVWIAAAAGVAAGSEASAPNSEEKIWSYLKDKGLADAGAGFGTDTNVITIITAKGEKLLPLLSKEETAGRILDQAAALADGR